jgi:hypothetical protein
MRQNPDILPDSPNSGEFGYEHGSTVAVSGVDGELQRG